MLGLPGREEQLANVRETFRNIGTRLLREWQGRVHEVLILDKGVEYRGKAWPSLSAVAREITGTRWSGPRFFGLNGASDGRG